MPPGPGTEHTSRALLKVLHLLTSTLWPPASFCRDREHQGHCCDLVHSCPPRSPPASHHADTPHTADDGVLLAVCLHHLLREEEIGFVIVPVIVVWDQVGCHKFGIYKQELAMSGGERGHSHHLQTPDHAGAGCQPGALPDLAALVPFPALSWHGGCCTMATDALATTRFVVPGISPAGGNGGAEGSCYR